MNSPQEILKMLKSLPLKNKKTAAITFISLSAIIYSQKSQIQKLISQATKPKRPQLQVQTPSSTTQTPYRIDKKIAKVAVDGNFISHLKFILRICVPTVNHPTVLIIAAHTAFLILRTWLSVIVAWLDGKLVRDMVARDTKEFFKGLIFWFGIAIPATFTNSMIRYCQSKLGLSLRKSLTLYLHDLYLKNKVYYKAINLDNRIDGADQLITTDVERFCSALASMYSNLGKPLLDMIIFNYQISQTIGFYGMVGLTLNWMVTARLMRLISPSFGKMAAEEAKLEGDFRTAHSRLITNAEEIAFYNGANLEKSILNRTYTRLIKHINKTYNVRIVYNMMEDFIIKYSWSAVGLMIASIPVFFPTLAGARTKDEQRTIVGEDIREGSRTQNFVTNKKLMMSLADAGSRIMYSYKDISQLAGYTFRVYNMIRVMQDLSENRYLSTRPNVDILDDKQFSTENIRGFVEYGSDGITLKNVPIATPSGDSLLVNDLTFSIGAGDHLMITGPNGAGKTSILRAIAGLWPLFRGVLERPNPSLSEIFYVPQRPYLVLGTLRDQVIYPHSVEEMKAAGKTDEDLNNILKSVYLEYIPAREGGWDTVKEWKDVFSGGEKQRMQIARVFYHNPRYVILDEATSAVSNDVEALMYTQAKDENITIITISHRPSLFKYHDYLLRIGEGDTGIEWVFEKIGANEEVSSSVEAEIRKIEVELKEAEAMKNRLTEIFKELSLDVKVGGGEELKHVKRTLI